MSKSSKKGSNSGGGGAEAILAVSLAVNGRTPQNGSIMALGCTAMTPQRQIIGTFSVNMLPLPGAAVAPPADITKYWRSKRDVLELITRQPLAPAAAFTQLQAFCKSIGKCTLVASPMMSVYLWLAHYWAVLSPAVSMPWGFSGTCARSFASGVLGIPVKELSTNPEYVASHAGYVASGYPLTDSIGTAAMFAHMQMLSMKQAPLSLSWAPNVSPVPPTVPTVISRLLTESDGIDLPFGEYPSITDPSFDEGCVDSFAACTDGVEWVATEKVHGSNILVLSDGQSIFRCGKRTSLLTTAENEVFFYFAHIMSPHEGQILKLAQLVLAAHPEGGLVSIVGELAGGEYVHPDVPLDMRGTRVQNGVQYAPANFFYAFDIAVRKKSADPKDISWDFLPYDESVKLFEAVGLLHAKALARGPLKQLLEMSEEFQTTIPSILGLPLIQRNFAEGLVLRPATKDVILADGRRVMMKRKHPDFKEFAKDAAPRDTDSLLSNMLCANRLAAVASKCTQEELGRVGAVASMLAADVLNDFKKLKPQEVITGEQSAALSAAAAAFVASTEGQRTLASRTHTV